MLGNDQGISALNYSAQNLWYLGQPDAALARAREAVTLARQLDDPFSLAFALFFETHLHCAPPRRCRAARARGGGSRAERGARLSALARPRPLVPRRGSRHAGRSQRAPRDHGRPRTRGRDGNPGWCACGLFAVLAEAQQAAGQLAEAQGTVATALAVAAQTGQFFFDADLHRLDGDLLLATGGTADEAAARYHRALAIAREQGARSLELRAATSLARLWRDQGKRAEARDLLAPVYGWFTEGFDTRDLIEAKALLEDLGGNQVSTRRDVP